MTQPPDAAHPAEPQRPRTFASKPQAWARPDELLRADGVDDHAQARIGPRPARGDAQLVGALGQALKVVVLADHSTPPA
jgi:hypothetical protein